MFSSTNFPSQQALAIETSGKNGSVALVHGRSILVQEYFSHDLKHAAGLLPLIDKLMRARNWTPSSLQHLYISQGPGSFTGLRIGITLAKALAFATGAKIVGVPTTRVLIENAPPDAKHAIIVLDAKRDQIFTARYERVGSDWIERQPAHLSSLTEMLAQSPRPLTLLGDGLPFHQQFLPPDQNQISISPPPTWTARAEIVASLGIQMALRNEFISPDHFAPLYIRKPEAEEKYDLLHQPSKR
jgi:tRNA threonylcarbamoyladenosine biosynthesis protein TsaB